MEKESFKIDKTKGKFQKGFTVDQELELVNHLETMESRLFGLTLTDFRRLTFQLASHKFNVINEMAEPDWMEKFLSRH